MRTPLTALLVSAAVAVGTLAGVPTPARAATERVTIAGSLQSELGCPGDWQPDCAATELSRVAGTSTWQATFRVPAGSYAFKVAVNGSWDENYGANGAPNGPDIPLHLEGAATISFSFDDESHRIGVLPMTLRGAATRADRRLAEDSLRAPLTRERYYFVMTDRFANGRRSNDTGGLVGSRSQTGFDPTDFGYFHGGDLRGLIGKLDYIKGLGTTAIWLTPSFKNRPVQGSGAAESAGYHGYWITDFTRIDPHLGTNAELKELIRKAHARGMKVFFDIITNHTADVIAYAEDEYDYVPTSEEPYRDADGNVFDPAEVAGTDAFPELDAAVSFPYQPVFRTPADATVKVPAWLNEPVRYHNRGDSTFAGESSEYGDFVGLDDLFTEDPAVVDGMIDIYKAWVDFGVDGFRIDTVKHVNTEFWQEFSPALLRRARQIGNRDFFMFGEVFDARPDYLSTFTTEGTLQATLDFGFQAQAQAFAQGGATTALRDLYLADDYYTDADSNAYQLPTFLGNHDMGRLAFLLKGKVPDAELLDRVELANALMFLGRGQPVTYYGDEQGFIGAGGDKAARQDMFATQVPSYASESVLGDAPGSKDRYDRSAPLYRLIRKLSALRRAHPALADGTQVHRYSSARAGVYAFSRVDRRGTEYLVALNNATTAKSATFDTFNARERFRPVWGTSSGITSDADGRVRVSVPPLSAVVYRARTRIDRGWRAPSVLVTAPAPGGVVGGRAEISATIDRDTFATASFHVRPVGTKRWQFLGADDNAPFRVFSDVTGYPTGTLLEYRVVVEDAAGRISASSSYGIVGTPEASGGDDGTVGPVTQPASVTIAGTLNSELGCGGDWDPACAAAHLTLDPKDQVWKGTFTLPAGTYEYKAALNDSWDENYGAEAVRNGGNISLTSTGQPITFYYDHRRHHVTSDAQGPIYTAPGSWNSELGCGADQAEDCLRPWLQDPDGDGTYTWASSDLPAGSYTFKIAEDFDPDSGSWLPAGDPVSVDVPADGLSLRVVFDEDTGEVTTRLASVPSLDQVKATWVRPGLIAWPTDALPGEPAQLEFRLHWGADGSLELDAEDITGGDSALLRLDRRGLPDAVVADHPELAGQLALRVDRATRRLLPGITAGDLAVGVYAGGRLVDAGAVDAAAVD